MSEGLRFSLDILTGKFEQDMKDMQKPIAAAATDTMDEVVSIVKPEARANIAAAGFSTRWQNALRVDRYPKGARQSIDAAVFLFHRIFYAGVFETGATISGKPYLWIPLPGSPKKIGRNRFTPQNVQRTIPLVSLRSRQGNPLLGATIRVSRTQANSDRPKVTLAALRRGRSGGSGVLRTVPLFVGIKQAHLRKQLNIAQICEKARDDIPRIYAQKFKG